ncbi:hypothetical protein COOONC_26919 [Cooperia oncophora]
MKMALFIPADGILRTHLTWEQLQKSVHIAFGKEAKFGPNKDVKEIGIGNGVMSKMCLISPHWQTRIKGVPQEFLVKISSQLSVVENKAFTEQNKVFSEELLKQLERQVKRVRGVHVCVN